MNRDMVLQKFMGFVLLVISCLYQYVPYEDGTYLVFTLPLGIALLCSKKRLSEWGD